jgi:ABC-type transporter Mla subunit MlaD
MSDDLIKRLGKSVWTLDQAADRIEQLEESNKELTLQLLATSGQAADALDKLAKAVEALRSLEFAATGAGVHHPQERRLLHEAIHKTRVTLAELEGMK